VIEAPPWGKTLKGRSQGGGAGVTFRILRSRRGRLERVKEGFGSFAERRSEDLEEARKRVVKSTTKATKLAREAARERAGRLAREGKRRVSSVEIRRHRKERSMFDLLFNRFTFGFAAGYVLGARAGRERYQQIVRGWNSFIGNPTVRQATERGRELVEDAGRAVTTQIQSRVSPQSIQDVMTPNPQTTTTTSTIADVAKKMRENDVGAMIVVDSSGKVVGIVTDRDIAVRAVAEGKDVSTAKVTDVISRDLTTLSPTDNVQDAVRLMRDRAIRRLPVVTNGRPVGIVSIGDLAVERDERSALADISSQPPNR
jgi:CBS domain-containing protein